MPFALLCSYGLKAEQIAEVDAALEELAAQTQRAGSAGALALVNLMGETLFTASLELHC